MRITRRQLRQLIQEQDRQLWEFYIDNSTNYIDNTWIDGTDWSDIKGTTVGAATLDPSMRYSGPYDFNLDDEGWEKLERKARAAGETIKDPS